MPHVRCESDRWKCTTAGVLMLSLTFRVQSHQTLPVNNGLFMKLKFLCNVHSGNWCHHPSIHPCVLSVCSVPVFPILLYPCLHRVHCNWSLPLCHSSCLLHILAHLFPHSFLFSTFLPHLLLSSPSSYPLHLLFSPSTSLCSSPLTPPPSL